MQIYILGTAIFYPNRLPWRLPASTNFSHLVVKAHQFRFLSADCTTLFEAILMLMVVFIADLEDFARLLILVIFFSVSIAEAIIAREPLPSPSRHCCHINSFFEGAVLKKTIPHHLSTFVLFSRSWLLVVVRWWRFEDWPIRDELWMILLSACARLTVFIRCMCNPMWFDIKATLFDAKNKHCYNVRLY